MRGELANKIPKPKGKQNERKLHEKSVNDKRSKNRRD
jgi:hypothetical protein